MSVRPQAHAAPLDAGGVGRLRAVLKAGLALRADPPDAASAPPEGPLVTPEKVERYKTQIKQMLTDPPLKMKDLDSADAPSRHYDLDDTCKSSVYLFRGVFGGVDPEQYNLLEDELVNAEEQKSQYNPNLNLRKKELTYGGPYKFGKRIPQSVPLAQHNTWPVVVKDALAFAKAFVAVTRTPAEAQRLASLYDGVHCNYYKDDQTSLDYHADDEDAMEAGAPIVSVTLIDPNPESTKKPRFFDIVAYDHKKGDDPLARLTLKHGDVLVMDGAMQCNYKHGVPPMKRPRGQARVAGRINLTARAFGFAKKKAAQPGPSQP